MFGGACPNRLEAAAGQWCHLATTVTHSSRTFLHLNLRLELNENVGQGGCSIGTCFSPEHDKSAFMIIIIHVIIVLVINIHSKHNRHFVVLWLFNLVVLIVSCANINDY